MNKSQLIKSYEDSLKEYEKEKIELLKEIETYFAIIDIKDKLEEYIFEKDDEKRKVYPMLHEKIFKINERIERIEFMIKQTKILI